MISQKRKTFFAIYWLIILVVLAVLQGCRVYPMTTSMPEDRGPYCGSNDDDLVKILEDLGDKAANGIKVEVCIPGGAELYDIQTYSLKDEDLERVKKVKAPVKLTGIYAYFKVLDTKTGKPITKFSPGLQLRISYPPGAWKEIEGRGFDQPRVFFLARENGKWADTWEEFQGGQIFEPGSQGWLDRKGYFEIIIDKLKDPLIGGC